MMVIPFDLKKMFIKKNIILKDSATYQDEKNWKANLLTWTAVLTLCRSEAWHTVMKSHGLTLSRSIYAQWTGASTINIVFQRELGKRSYPRRNRSHQEKKCFVQFVSRSKNVCPVHGSCPTKSKKDGLIPMVVTVPAIPARTVWNTTIRECFVKNWWLQAFDVKYVNLIEPYLDGIEKADLKLMKPS